MDENAHKWPADAVERRSVASLVPYARNARTHSDGQIDQLVASIREWGWTTPVLIDEGGMIIAGHGRVMAAQRMGLVDVPCMVARGWSDDQKRAYVLADNQLALNAGWDADLLALEVSDLNDLGFNLDLIGFADPAAIMARGNSGLTDPDDVPDAPANPVSVLGDIWVLGRHRIICGDSTNAETVKALLGDVRPHLMVTDPPYGVEYDASFRKRIRRADGSIGGAHAVGKVENDNRADWREAWALSPAEVAYVWCASLYNHVVAESLIASGYGLRSQIIWDKGQIAISRGHYHWQHEPCWYAVKDGATGHWQGDRKQSTVWDIPKPRKSETGHSTQKPVECMKRPIENNSSPGQAVYEPFSGSGTTIIAGEMTGRHVYAIELSPAYVDVAVKRWQDFTGQEATLEGGGTFAEVAAQRHQAAA